MKTLLAAAAFAIASFGAAQAMPLAPLSAADTAAVIQVAQGCGPGFARGPMGRCRPMGVVVRRPPVVVVRPAARRCHVWGPGRRVCRTWY